VQIGLLMKPLPPPNEQPIDGMPKAYHFLLLWINVQRGEPLVMARSTWQLLPLVHTQFAAPFPVARQGLQWLPGRSASLHTMGSQRRSQMNRSC